MAKTSQRTKRGRSAASPTTTHCTPGNFDGRLAVDIVQAALTIRTVERLDRDIKREAKQRAKVAAITLDRTFCEDA